MLSSDHAESKRRITMAGMDRSVVAGIEGRGASLKQRAYDELKRRILSGSLAPGTLLSERLLAIELKMSKTPVHAALERLETDGLVTVAAQQGIIVREISPQDIGDHFELREAIEPFLVARLAGRLGADSWQRLDRNLHENQLAVDSADVAANVRLDAEFHLLLCEFLGNREITRVMVQIREKAHNVIYQISTRHPERMATSLAEHVSIAEAIRAGDPAAASERMTTHLRNGIENLYNRGYRTGQVG
jgi:DNA-binding GntR family transcriptional regulator